MLGRLGWSDRVGVRARLRSLPPSISSEERFDIVLAIASFQIMADAFRKSIFGESLQILATGLSENFQSNG